MTYQLPKVWSDADSDQGKFSGINQPTAGARFEQKLPVGKEPFQLYSLGTPNGGAQPARVQLARKQQVNQIGLVGRIGRDRQQLLAQTARQLAQESRARRKAQIRQQWRLIRGGDEHRPPAPPALPPPRPRRRKPRLKWHTFRIFATRKRHHFALRHPSH